MDNTTNQVGDTAPQPPNTGFTIDRRLPGWHPDTQNDGATKLFPEESLGTDSNSLLWAFPMPHSAGGDFAEPDPNTGTAAEWNAFNRWILGEPFVPKAGNAFDSLLTSIGDAVRKYNAHLYWMRRLHFHKLYNGATASVPPQNPHGPADEQAYGAVLNPLPANYSTLAANAENDWKTAVDRLKDLLLPGAERMGFKNITADMVQVNGYIVSIRVVADPVTAGSGPSPAEIPGSSSSHNSVSSGMSSSSP